MIGLMQGFKVKDFTTINKSLTVRGTMLYTLPSTENFNTLNLDLKYFYYW